MPKLLNCTHMELLCRQRAIADPVHRTKWLARAERWRNLGQRNENVRQSNSLDELGPMAMGPNTIAGDERWGKWA